MVPIYIISIFTMSILLFHASRFTHIVHNTKLLLWTYFGMAREGQSVA